MKLFLTLFLTFEFLHVFNHYKSKYFLELNELERIVKENNKNLKKLYNILSGNDKFNRTNQKK